MRAYESGRRERGRSRLPKRSDDKGAHNKAEHRRIFRCRKLEPSSTQRGRPGCVGILPTSKRRNLGHPSVDDIGLRA